MNTAFKIPSELYRGDADKHGARKLKETIHFGQLQTNLINGGEGRLINEVPLQQLINRHIGINWRQTHFLSFSDNLFTAFRYGIGTSETITEDLVQQQAEYQEDISDFGFAIITLHSDKVNWDEIEPGVFEGFYTPSLTKFTMLTEAYRIILIDVVKVFTLSNNAKYAASLKNALRDNEWLVLPATPVLFNSGQAEYSAILDGACISYKKYLPQ